MILHQVAFTWRESVTDDDVRALTAALTEMATQIPSIRSYVAATNLRVRPSDVDYAIAAIVDDEAGLAGYLDHPAHLAVYESHLGPMLASRHASQLPLSAGTLTA
jgi:hypothetical protein